MSIKHYIHTSTGMRALTPELAAQFPYNEHPKYVRHEDYAALENDSHITAQALNSSMDMVRTLDSKLADLESENTRLQAELRELKSQKITGLYTDQYGNIRRNADDLAATQESALKPGE